jgi:precorrin-6A synthase
VHVTTGRRLAEGWPEGADDVVVMLDGQCAFLTIAEDDIDIYWSAYLGSESELSVSGPLRERKHEIARKRAEARARRGWIMDIYLLRKRGPAT